MIARRIGNALVAFGLVVASSFCLASVAPASAAEDGTPSAISRSGIGDFSGLRVTVDQTKNLIDQVVRISWTGGTQTAPGSGQYAINYLQIMQCWGDAGGPDRDQCQFGGLTGDLRGGAFTASRQVNYGSGLRDPAETIKQTPGSFKNAYVPFKSVTGKVEEGSISEFFDANTTNEVPYAVSRSDGSGQDFFPVQTVRDAPGLGCGEPITKSGKTVGRSCWIVVVPRNDVEVDGSKRTITSNNQLISSPLGVSNWKNRMVFPLEFEPVGKPCPLGASERLTAGQENVGEAIVRWQPALCTGGGPIYGYSQVSDDIARRQLLTEDPGMVFITQPLDASKLASGRSVLYAPIAVSGISVAFNVESQSPFRAPPEIKAKDGLRITDMRLTPRLVAKLITQTYTRAADVGAPSVAGNPVDLTKDEEFKALNPQFNGLSLSLPDALLPAGRSDVANLVWSWIKADPDAKAFLDGKADPWGTTINSNYKEMEVPRYDYPKSETYCREFLDGKIPQCTLDLHPYTADMKDGAKAAARGDTLARSVWDPTTIPVAWKKGPAQPSGNRGILAIVDTPSAERYGLNTAALMNASNEFVEPTTTAMNAAVKSFKKVAGVSILAPNPRVSDAKAYPLTNVSYAAVVPQTLSTAAKKEYANLLKYAAGPGQKLGVAPGQLPYGYAPLSDELATQTAAAATTLLSASAPAKDSNSADGAAGDGGSSGTESIPAPAIPPGEVLPSSGGAGSGSSATGAGGQAVSALTTPSDSAGVARLVPIAALVLGLAAAFAGPVLLRMGSPARQ